MEYYPEYSENDYRLYHHGILGMHWGKRNGPPYPLGASDHSASEQRAGWRQSLSNARAASRERRAERKAANKYDYRDNDQYRNAKGSSKKYLDAQYNADKHRYGKRVANRIAYATKVKGEKGSEIRKKENIKRLAKSAALAAVVYVGYNQLLKGAVNYTLAREYAKYANQAVSEYARVAGLNTVKGGFTMGSKAVELGRSMYKRYGWGLFT